MFETQRRLLEPVCDELVPANDLREVAEYAGKRAFGLILIDHTIPAPEKLRVCEVLQGQQPECPVVEIYAARPEIPNAHARVRFGDGAEALLGAVKSVLHSMLQARKPRRRALA